LPLLQLRRTEKANAISNSHGVSSPTTHEPERVHSTPACHTDYVPSSGFLTLSTDSSSLGRPALFHAGNAHGVRPSGVFPHCQVLRLVTEELPSWRFSSALLSKLHNPGRPISATLHQGSPRHEPLPPSGPCSDSESVPPLDCYIRCERPIPS
jgi:hypothetical protein